MQYKIYLNKISKNYDYPIVTFESIIQNIV